MKREGRIEFHNVSSDIPMRMKMFYPILVLLQSQGKPQQSLVVPAGKSTN